MVTTIKFARAANTLTELSSAVRALEATDELYRLLTVDGESYQRKDIDFRRLPLKRTPGANAMS